MADGGGGFQHLHEIFSVCVGYRLCLVAHGLHALTYKTGEELGLTCGLNKTLVVVVPPFEAHSNSSDGKDVWVGQQSKCGFAKCLDLCGQSGEDVAVGGHVLPEGYERLPELVVDADGLHQLVGELRACLALLLQGFLVFLDDLLILLHLLGQRIDLVLQLRRLSLQTLNLCCEQCVLLPCLRSSPSLAVKGNGIVADIALELSHVGIKVFQVGIKRLYVREQFLTRRGIALGLCHAVESHPHALQLQRHLTIAALGDRSGLGLVVDDLHQLGLLGTQLQRLFLELLHLGNRLSLSDGVGLLVLFYLLDGGAVRLEGTLQLNQLGYILTRRSKRSVSG